MSSSVKYNLKGKHEDIHGGDRSDGAGVGPERRERRSLACLLDVAVREPGGERSGLGDRLGYRDDIGAVDHVGLETIKSESPCTRANWQGLTVF